MNIAIVTGASSGIGKEFVLALKENKQIDEFWLIARRKEKLEELTKKVQKEIQIFSMDLTKEESYEELENKLKKEIPNITYLVCAAGSGKVGSISDLSLVEQENMIKLNVLSSVKVTKIALNYMQENAHIFEIGSIVGFQPMPYFSVYGATKSFLESYTKSLHYELRKQKIKVTLVSPYWVKDTEFISKADVKGERYKKYPFATTKEKVVKRAVFYNRMNMWVCTPDGISFLDRILSKLLPDVIYVRIINIFSKI